ncbi:MAG: GIY-YIG nuclease family protein [Chloroflexi bacterium]|nr:GIY-YIG nuclease family protein [Chloroflexota bacterium]
MSQDREYFVYIMASHSRVIYTGVTNDLFRRVYEHKTRKTRGFTNRYNVIHLVYYESTDSIHIAIQREKQIKGWLREKKVQLIESTNPDWNDLAAEWYP